MFDFNSNKKIRMLQRLITLYDPTNPVLRPLVLQCRVRHRTNSRNSLSSSVELTETQVLTYVSENIYSTTAIVIFCKAYF